MSFAAIAAPIVAYAIAFQTLVYLSLPQRRRRTWAPVTTGVIGAVLTLGATAIFGPLRMGLNPPSLVSTLSWGVSAALFAIAIGALFLASARGRRVLADPRIARLSPRQLRIHVFVRIPFFTVLVEETFFRGLLHAVLVALYPLEVAVILGAVLFGLWHVGPALDQAKAGGASGLGGVAHTALTVVITAFAGLFLVWLRVETGTVWAPAAVHAAINMTMSVYARLAGNRPAPAMADSLPACTYAVSSSVSPGLSQEVPSGSA